MTEDERQKLSDEKRQARYAARPIMDRCGWGRAEHSSRPSYARAPLNPEYDLGFTP